jgi:sensor histidine kinase YesM
MQIRFEDKLEIDVQVSDDAREALVPNLILQPLVENAVKHGVEKISGIGRIEISAMRNDDQLVLGVCDNGPGPSSLNNGDHGVGLRNIRERLEHMYGDAQSLTLVERTGGGTIARIEIPFRSRAELRTTVVSEEAGV